jgi:hypothetical protein
MPWKTWSNEMKFRAAIANGPGYLREYSAFLTQPEFETPSLSKVPA